MLAEIAEAVSNRSVVEVDGLGLIIILLIIIIIFRTIDK